MNTEKDRCVKSTHVTRHRGLVNREARERLHRHKGCVLWFTGLSASGKSTISHLVEKKLHDMHCSTYVFDGDNVRHGLCGDLGFSDIDRKENIRRIGEMVHLFVDAGVISLTAFISPFREDRQRVRDIVGADCFIEIFVDCPIEECIKRDPKGIYHKAMKGEIKHFTGISSPYEPPESPDLLIKSAEEHFDMASERVVSMLKKKGFVHC